MSLAAAIPGLGKLLDYFAGERHHRDEQKDAALTAIYAAASETTIYLADLEREKNTDRKREQDIARLWSAAAVPIRHFDMDLADRCLLKFEFWVNPDKWNADEATERRIAIEAVLDKARELMMSR